MFAVDFRTHLPTTRDRNLHFRGAVSTGLFDFSPVDFFAVSPGFLRNMVRNSPQKCGENCPTSERSKRRRILSRFWLSWFFRSRGLFWLHNAKIRWKNPPENRPAENKKSAGARPPRNSPARPQKNPPQNLPTNSHVKLPLK